MKGHHATPPTESVLPEPLNLLYEEPGLPHQQLPTPLATAYGGELGFAEPELIVGGSLRRGLS